MSSCSKTGWRASWVSSHPTCAYTRAQRSSLFRKERKEIAVWVSSPRSSASWRKKSCTFFRKGESPKDATHVSNFWIQARSSIFSVHLWICLFTSSQSWDRSISPILDGPDEAVED